MIVQLALIVGIVVCAVAGQAAAAVFLGVILVLSIF
jgi:hypothetical protein